MRLKNKIRRIKRRLNWEAILSTTVVILFGFIVGCFVKIAYLNAENTILEKQIEDSIVRETVLRNSLGDINK